MTGQHRNIQCFSWVTGIAYSPDGGTIAVAGDTWGSDKAVMVKLYNVVTGETKATFAKHPGLSRSGIVGIVNSLAYSPDGGTIAVSRDTMVDLYDVVTGEIKVTLTEFKEKIIELVYAPDGGTIATGGRWGFRAIMG